MKFRSVLKYKMCYTYFIGMEDEEFLNMFTCNFDSEMNKRLDNVMRIKEL